MSIWSGALLIALVALVIFLIVGIAEEIDERETKWNRNTRNWTNIPYFEDNHIRKQRRNKKIDFDLREQEENEGEKVEKQ